MLVGKKVPLSRRRRRPPPPINTARSFNGSETGSQRTLSTSSPSTLSLTSTFLMRYEKILLIKLPQGTSSSSLSPQPYPRQPPTQSPLTRPAVNFSQASPKPRQSPTTLVKSLRQAPSEPLEAYYSRTRELLLAAGGPVSNIAPATQLPPGQRYVLDSVCEHFVQGLLDDDLYAKLVDFLESHGNEPVSLATVYERALEEERGLRNKGKEARRAQERRRREGLEELYGYISDVRSRNEIAGKRFGGYVGRIVDFLDRLTVDPGFRGRAPWE